MNERLTKDWIVKVEKLLEKEITEAEKINQKIWLRANNYPGVEKAKKRYLNSPKGKIALKKIYATRYRKFKRLTLSKDEKKMIQNFYVECPLDCHVDHIIPLAKGGCHRLANLQWLPKMVNLKKHTKIYLKPGDYPQCLISVKNGQI